MQYSGSSRVLGYVATTAVMEQGRGAGRQEGRKEGEGRKGGRHAREGERNRERSESVGGKWAAQQREDEATTMRIGALRKVTLFIPLLSIKGIHFNCLLWSLSSLGVAVAAI